MRPVVEFAVADDLAAARVYQGLVQLGLDPRRKFDTVDDLALALWLTLVAAERYGLAVAETTTLQQLLMGVEVGGLAERLEVSERTISHRLTGIARKLGVDGVEAILACARAAAA